MLRFLSSILSLSWNFIAEHWNSILTIGAFVISLVDLALHFIAHRKENVHLRISQVPGSAAYSFAFTWYDRYELLFCQVSIDNRSRQPITLADFRLTAPDGKSYPAAEYALGDHHNDAGLTLYNPSDRNKGCFFNLKSENLLPRARFEANDSKSGYLVFFGVPPVKAESSKFRLSVRAGKKHYSAPITVSPLPDDLRPWSELPRR